MIYKMKIQLLYISILCYSSLGFSQNSDVIYPGGVKGATHWYTVDINEGTPILKSHISSNHSLKVVQQNPISWINYHPSLNLNGQNQVTINLNDDDINGATYFTVYQSKNHLQENHIWHIEKNGLPSVVLTTQRIADLDDIKYMNFLDLAPLHPKINVYAQLKSKDNLETLHQKWNIGKTPSTPSLPITDFHGNISELIVFNRVLDRTEKLKVSSYLAIKYGITLADASSTYLNSSGTIIWDGRSNTPHYHNIAGIARDDNTGLNLKIASSSSSPGLMSISVDQDLDNNSFILWGDNDKSLTLAPKLIGLPKLLKRKWILKKQGIKQDISTEIIIDTKEFNVSSQSMPVYWMAVDNAVTGNFNHSDVEYIKMTRLDKNGFATFNYKLKKSNNSKHLFSFIVGKNLMMASSIVHPKCSDPKTGELEIKILGGLAPYEIIVQNVDGIVSEQTVYDAKHIEKTKNLSSGKYEIRISDSNSQVYSESFYLNNTDAPQAIAISDSYQLPPKGNLLIDASKKMAPGILYHWNGPGDFESMDAQVEIENEGIYVLTLNKNGCIYKKDVTVTSEDLSVFKAELVHPNPSRGTFYIKVRLHEPAPIKVSIYSASGKEIKSEIASGQDNYIFKENLVQDGVYYIVLRSRGVIKTEKLIIIN